MKKAFGILFCILSFAVLASCGSKQLPDWADTDALTEKARVMIDTLNAYDYEGVAALYDDPAVDASTFEAAGELIEEAGAFVDYGQTAFTTGTADDGRDYVCVIQIANYENEKYAFTVSYFEDGSVAGFYLK